MVVSPCMGSQSPEQEPVHEGDDSHGQEEGDGDGIEHAIRRQQFSHHEKQQNRSDDAAIAECDDSPCRLDHGAGIQPFVGVPGMCWCIEFEHGATGPCERGTLKPPASFGLGGILAWLIYEFKLTDWSSPIHS